MQRCLDAHSGLPITTASLNLKQHRFLTDHNLSVRVDKILLIDIETNAKLNPHKIGQPALDQLLLSFETANESIYGHGPIFVRWAPERIAALQEVSGVLVGCGFSQQAAFCYDLDRIRTQCESALQLTERFPAILAKCNDVKLPPRLYSLVPAELRTEAPMSLFQFLTLSLKNRDPVKYLDDQVARLRDASSNNLKEARDTRANYDTEIRKCDEARDRLKDCLARSQNIASSVLVDEQCVSDARAELAQACNQIAAVLLSVRAAQSIMQKAQQKEKGIISKFDANGRTLQAFTKWRTDLEMFDHAPHCLDAFLTEVRQRRTYHGCLAAFEEMMLSRLEAAKTKEHARRVEFQSRFSTHMPSEFRDMLLDPVPVLRVDKRLRPCGIHQLEEVETLPIDTWLRAHALDLSASGAESQHGRRVTDTQDASTRTDDKTFSNAGTNTAQLPDDSAAIAKQAALEAQEKAALEEQQLLLRSQFDAEVSGYQMQLSEVERTKDTQLVVQSNVIMAMLDMLQLPHDFPVFPEWDCDLQDSSNRAQLQQFLAAFQSHTQLNNREREASQYRQKEMQVEIDALRRHVEGLTVDLKNLSAHVAIPAAAGGMTPSVMYADACDNSSPALSHHDEEELARLRVREYELSHFSADMEERLRCALHLERQAKQERDGALEQVERLQQYVQTMMREVRRDQEGHIAPYPHQLPPPPPRLASPVPEAPAAAATFAQLEPQQQPAVVPPMSPKHIETDSLLAKLLEMGYEPQRASETIAAMSAQGNVPNLDDVVERLLNS